MTQQEIKAFMDKMHNNEAQEGEAIVKPVGFPPIDPSPSGPTIKASITHLDDVSMDIYVQLGQAELKVRELLNLKVDSILELNKASGESADVFINNRAFARGEILVINDNFAVRINNISRGSSVCNLKDSLKGTL